MNYIYWFDQIRPRDHEKVGGKNAGLAMMIRELSHDDILVPNGFALSSDAYWYFIQHNRLLTRMKKIMSSIKDYNAIAQVQKAGHEIRTLLLEGTMPDDLREQLIQAYHELSKQYHTKYCDVAVRSSATAEDLPTASFAGQLETFLNVKGDDALIKACKKSIASLFTNRAIVYRKENKFDQFKVALSVGIQKMIRSDKASAGVAFSLDTETGFKNVIIIDSAWGLGESVVKGDVNPDEFCVFKPTLEKGFDPILKKSLGDKRKKIIYRTNSGETKHVMVPKKDQKKFSLTDKQVISLAHMVNRIDQFYSKRNGHWTPMDIEWARDGIDGKIYIVQARPETVHSQENHTHVYRYVLGAPKPDVLISGIAIGQQIVSGVARVVKDVSHIKDVKKNDIIITTMTDPDWVPVIKQAAGIITDLGGRTCHAAIVSRELNRAAIVGTEDATKKIKNGQKITIDCSQGSRGFVYAGLVPFEKKELVLNAIPKLKTKLLVNIANPDYAFTASMLPVSGVGLARIEFIIANDIKIHPMALIEPKKITDKKVKAIIAQMTAGYTDKKQFFVDKLTQGISVIAAAFYPRPVIVRLSDFKTNEYRDLIGGKFFEPNEANPMLGFRGASRYVNDQYKDAFALECKAIRYAREKMGLDNIKVMIPFVRTVQEAQAVIELLSKNGLDRQERTVLHKMLRKQSGLQLVMMVEVPSNVILIKEFAKLFDSFSIGSNDLTQLILGVDRDSAQLAGIFDERNPAVEQMIVEAIEGAHKAKRPIGICGQGPSDYPDFAEFLIKHKIDSISLNPDAVLTFLLRR